MAESTSDDQFRILQREIREAIRRNHPNPERIDCPGNASLRRIAEATASPSDPAYSHVMECSPCYEELMELTATVEARRSKETAHRRQRALVVAIVAAVVIAGIAIYMVSKSAPLQPKQSPVPVVSNPQQTLPKAGGGDSLSVAMLNLDSETSVRSTGDQRNTTELQRLPRKRLDLTVNLPRGLEAGTYEFALSKDDGPPVLTLTGQAKIEGGLTVLHVLPDLSPLAPGQYHLRIRRAGSAWRDSEVVLF